MKKILLCIFLLSTINFYSQVSDIVHCSGDTIFDLTSQNSLLIGSINPNEIIRITYHLTLADANSESNTIANPTHYLNTTGSQVIYARINHLGVIKTNYFSVIVKSPLESTAIVNTPLSCINNGAITVTASGGQAPYAYSINGSPYLSTNYFSNLIAGEYTISVKDINGCLNSMSAIITEPSSLLIETITVTDLNCNENNDGSITVNTTGGQTPYTYSINNSTYQPENYFSNLTAGTHNVIIKDANGCIASTFVVITQPDLLLAAIAITNQTVTTNTTGGIPPYTYSLDGAIYSTDHTFTNLPTGTYRIWTRDAKSCITSMDFVINAPAPLINNSNTITLKLIAGQTLADIIVEGENIKWYSTPGTSTGKIKHANKKAGEIPLPLNTVLVDNTTYYASQTINGIESSQRLAVTVQLNALATPDFVLANFKSYPNPVKNNLTIQNTSIIDEIILLSITGKPVLTKKIKTLRSEIDLSTFSSGIYFLKVKSERAEKIVKIIKE